MTRTAVLFLLAIALLVAVAPTGDPDLWWHLRTGQLALATRSTLPADPFSYSFAGQPWRYKDLAAEVLLYGGFRAFSFYWFVALKLAAVLLLFCALYSGRALLALAATALTLADIQLIERPALFSILAFPLLLRLLQRALRARATTDSRALIVIFLPISCLQWGWVNLHRAAAVGYLLLLGFALAASLARRAFSRRWLAGAWGSLALAAGLGLLNLNGLEVFRASWSASQNSLLRQTISEWQPMPLGALAANFPFVLGLAALGLALGASALAAALFRRDLDRALLHGWNLLPVISFLALAPNSVRWVTYLAIAAAFAAVNGAATLIDARRKGPRGWAALVGVALTALIFLRRPAPFQLGEDAARQPVAAVAFARTHGLSGRVMNAFDLGGYIIWTMWPETRVFADGRNETVYSPQFLSQALRSEQDAWLFDSLQRQGGATWVMAVNTPGRGSHRFLARNPDWSAVFWSEAAIVYVQRAAHPDLEPLRYRLLNASAPVESVEALVARGDAALFPQLESELLRLLSGDPASVRGHVALLVYYDLRGLTEKRNQVLARLRAIAPDHPVVRQIAARLR